MKSMFVVSILTKTLPVKVPKLTSSMVKHILQGDNGVAKLLAGVSW